MYHYCSLLTGAELTSIPYGRDKARDNNSVQLERIKNYGQADQVKTIEYELVFDYKNKNYDEDELIYLTITTHSIYKDQNEIKFNYARVNTNNSLSISMNEGGYDIILDHVNVSPFEIEMAVLCTKWIICKDMGSGRIAANEAVSRKNYNPNPWRTENHPWFSDLGKS